MRNGTGPRKNKTKTISFRVQLQSELWQQSNKILAVISLNVVNNRLMCGNGCSQWNDCFALCCVLLTSFVSHWKFENKKVARGLFLYSLPLLLEKHTEEKKIQTVKESNMGKRETKQKQHLCIWSNSHWCAVNGYLLISFQSVMTPMV